MAGAAVAATLAIGMVGAAVIVPTASANTDVSDQNQPSYWQAQYPGSTCDKPVGEVNGPSYVLPAPPAGTSYVAVIVKAGSPQSIDVTNNIFDATHNTMPATGVTVTTYNSAKNISHIIRCLIPTTPPPSGPTCVESPVYSYTYTVATASGVITVTAPGAKNGDTLCTPLYVRAATWTYNLPTTGNNPSWPQTLEGYADVTVNAIGTFPYAAPDVATCKQHDIYATFDATGFAKLALPTNLLGSHNPYEPAFLHETLANKGPNPTYTTDPSVGCLALAHEALASVASQQTCDSTDGQYTNGTITIPASENVTYKIGATEKGAGTYSYAPGTYTVTVTPAAGYKLTGPASYDLVLTDIGPCLILANEAQATPSAQTCNTSTGDVTSGYIKIPTSKHVTFYIGDSTVAAVPDSINPVAPGDYVIHVYPDANYTLTGPASYTVTVLPVDCPIPVTIETDPEVVQPQCIVGETTTLVSGYITVAVTDHVTYSITGTTDDNAAVSLTDVGAKTDLPPGHYTVTAAADAGFVLAGEHVGPWEKTITAYDGVCGQIVTHADIPTAVISTNQVCTAGVATGGTITVGRDVTGDGYTPYFGKGVTYFINGTQVTSEVTSVPAGTYKVTATVDDPEENAIQDGDLSSWTITVAAPSTDCAQLKTLAFTGADGSMGGMLIFALFLLLGGAGVYTASRFRSRES